MPGDSILPIEGMLEALRRLEGYAEVGAREGYPRDGALMDAILRRVDLLSTYAHAVSEGFVAENPDLPWRRLRALRDVIRAYGGGDPELAWAFVRNLVPGLRRGVEELLEAARLTEGPQPAAAGEPQGGGRILRVHPGRVAVAKLDPAAPPPPWWPGVSAGNGWQAPLTAEIRTPSEWTVYVPGERLPDDAPAQRGFRVLELEGPLAFDMVGVLASLAGALARSGIPLMALSTWGATTTTLRHSMG